MLLSHVHLKQTPKDHNCIYSESVSVGYPKRVIGRLKKNLENISNPNWPPLHASMILHTGPPLARPFDSNGEGSCNGSNFYNVMKP